MIQIGQSDYGHYERWYTDSLGDPALPDWNASLYLEFRDSAGVLQFTATTGSTPALQSGVDSHGPYVYISGIPLTAFALGIVDVSCYAEMGGISVVPLPELATAFEVVDDGTLVDQLRDILKLDDNSQDTTLLALIESAAAYAEEYLARSFLTQSRTKQIQAPVSRGLSSSMLKNPTILLTYPPVTDVTRVYTVDNYGNETDITDYWLDDVSNPPELHLDAITWSNKLRVDYSAGYGASYSDLPDSIQRGILLHAAHMFKYRSDCSNANAAVDSGAVAAYRIHKIVRRG